MLTLYHGRTSVCSIKARLALAEKGVSFDSRVMTLRGDQFDPGYMQLNPNAVVPTIVHDGRVVIESTVIMHYVDEAFPGPALMPPDLLARSQARMMTKLMDEYVHVACMTLTFATANREWLARMTPQEMEAGSCRLRSGELAKVEASAVGHHANLEREREPADWLMSERRARADTLAAKEALACARYHHSRHQQGRAEQSRAERTGHYAIGAGSTVNGMAIASSDMFYLNVW
jgi:glutathione S-transferase